MSNYYKTITDYPTSTGAMPLLYSIRDSIPYAFDGLLVVIFILIFAGNYFLIKTRMGKSKIMTALLASSFVLILLSLLLALAQLVSFNSVLFWSFCTIVVFILYILSEYW